MENNKTNTDITIKDNRMVINCTRESVTAFIARLKKIDELVLKSYKKATESVPQERYTFVADIENISVVHETRSNNVVVTASAHILALFKDEYEILKRSIAAGASSTASSGNSAKSDKPIAKPASPVQAKPPQVQTGNKQQKPVGAKENQQNSRVEQTGKPQQKPVGARAEQPQIQSNRTKQLQIPSGKSQQKSDDAGILGVTRFKLESMLNKINGRKDAFCTPDKNSFREGCEIYNVSYAKNTVVVKYHAQTLIAEVIGKGKLYDEIISLLSQAPLSKVATDETKLKAVERKLKKLLPHAFDILSEQSRLDISIGMVDIQNDKVRLSDYSMLLVPLYRGLERLIFDLQKARDIDVKMIGQAYERPDGKYILKSGYRKRVNSHVYCEVMSALYTEYFEKRNFYAHSDITGDSLSRVIESKETVKNIFNSLIEIIEYNIFKLKEINFWNQN